MPKFDGGSASGIKSVKICKKYLPISFGLLKTCLGAAGQGEGEEEGGGAGPERGEPGQQPQGYPTTADTPRIGGSAGTPLQVSIYFRPQGLQLCFSPSLNFASYRFLDFK